MFKLSGWIDYFEFLEDEAIFIFVLFALVQNGLECFLQFLDVGPCFFFSFKFSIVKIKRKTSLLPFSWVSSLKSLRFLSFSSMSPPVVTLDPLYLQKDPSFINWPCFFYIRGFFWVLRPVPTLEKPSKGSGFLNLVETPSTLLGVVRISPKEGRLESSNCRLRISKGDAPLRKWEEWAYFESDFVLETDLHGFWAFLFEFLQVF